MAVDLRGLDITWSENPLATVVRLDGYGRLRLRHGIAKDIICELASLMSLERKRVPRQHGDSWLDDVEYSGDNTDEKIEAMATWYEQELGGTHCGDCTCVPATCAKCHAEEFLGIRTTDGLGKHSGHYVQRAFEGGRTLAQARAHLKTYVFRAEWAGWEVHVPRWTKERDEALAWLERYAKEHGF